MSQGTDYRKEVRRDEIFKIASVNINGLANAERVWKLYHYFVGYRIDILLVQEVRRLVRGEGQLDSMIQKYFIYETEGAEGSSNGVGIMLNPVRFGVVHVFKSPQLLILEIEDKKSKERMVVINIYLNPTYHKRPKNLDVIEKVEATLEYVLVNRRKVIIGGDFNHEFSHLRSVFKDKYGLEVSNFDSTRVRGNDEIDLIGTSDTIKKQYLDHKDFMSDHY